MVVRRSPYEREVAESLGNLLHCRWAAPAAADARDARDTPRENFQGSSSMNAPQPDLSRTLFAGLGWCAVALAFAGAVLPVLPSTVFVLVASYCFSKSSPRFAAWLHRHRWFGPVLTRWVAERGMPRSAKRHALVAMWTAVLVSALLLVSRLPLAAFAVAGLGVIGTFSILFAVRTLPE